MDPSLALVVAALIAAAASIVVARLNSKKLDNIHVLVNSSFTTIKDELKKTQEALEAALDVIRAMKANGAIDPRDVTHLPPPSASR